MKIEGDLRFGQVEASDLVDRVFKSSNADYGIIYDQEASGKVEGWDYTTSSYVARFVNSNGQDPFDIVAYNRELSSLHTQERYIMTGDIDTLDQIFANASMLKTNSALDSEVYADAKELFGHAKAAGLNPLIGFTINTDPRELSGISRTQRWVVVPFMHPGSLEYMSDGAEKIARAFSNFRLAKTMRARGRPA